MSEDRGPVVHSGVGTDSKIDEQALLYHTRHDMDGGGDLSVSVVDAVTEAAGVDPMDMEPPFYEYFDPQSLDGLFLPKHDGTPRVASAHLVLSVYGHTVVVHSDGRIRVYGQGGSDPDDTEKNGVRQETRDPPGDAETGRHTEG